MPIQEMTWEEPPSQPWLEPPSSRPTVPRPVPLRSHPLVRAPVPGSRSDWALRITCPGCGAEAGSFCVGAQAFRAERMRILKMQRQHGASHKASPETMLCVARKEEAKQLIKADYAALAAEAGLPPDWRPTWAPPRPNRRERKAQRMRKKYGLPSDDTRR